MKLLSDDIGVNYELGMFLIYATQTTHVHYDGRVLTGTCYIASNRLFSDYNFLF